MNVHYGTQTKIRLQEERTGFVSCVKQQQYQIKLLKSARLTKILFSQLMKLPPLIKCNLKEVIISQVLKWASFFIHLLFLVAHKIY